jgi:hypothetical protein
VLRYQSSLESLYDGIGGVVVVVVVVVVVLTSERPRMAPRRPSFSIPSFLSIFRATFAAAAASAAAAATAQQWQWQWQVVPQMGHTRNTAAPSAVHQQALIPPTATATAAAAAAASADAASDVDADAAVPNA